MHQCFKVDEILRLFAGELVASGAKAAAVSLACCRRSFEEPVLDVLWGAQTRLFPLLKALPGDVWKVEAGRYVSLLTILTFFSSNRFAEAGFHETSNKTGMASFPTTRPGNDDAHSGRL